VASFRGKGKIDGTEWGPVFKSKKDYIISDILLTIKSISYQWCMLSFNVYEIQGGKFVKSIRPPVRHSPVPYGQHRQIVALLGSADEGFDGLAHRLYHPKRKKQLRLSRNCFILGSFSL